MINNSLLEEFKEKFEDDDKQLFQEAFGWHDVIKRQPERAAQVLVRHLVMGDAYCAVADYDIVGNTNKFTEANKGVKEFVLNVTHWCHIMHLD